LANTVYGIQQWQAAQDVDVARQRKSRNGDQQQWHSKHASEQTATWSYTKYVFISMSQGL
jgi:hypothetical protein